MKASIRSNVVTFGCLALLGAGTALAADWPQWRGANGDARVTDFKTPET